MTTEYDYPDDGIEDQIDVDESVWDRGYFREVDGGTWYEVFVNKEISNMSRCTIGPFFTYNTKSTMLRVTK